ncbi:MAG: aspartate/glutamate racemase family protein [Chloroflexi bacterium]|nr:aspartate/glutamate racemase family protein [Chloroflexota bacterium]
MRILIINPNTSQAITDKVRAVAQKVKRSDCEITAICPEHGPVTIESSFDEAYAIAPTIDLVKKANEEGQYDAIILACFCEVGVEAAREVSAIPVLGMEEPTLAMALVLGEKFGIMTEKAPRVPMKVRHIRRYGLMERLASVRPLGLGVAELNADPKGTQALGMALARQMIEEDHAEVIIMGCAAMAGYSDEIQRELGIPVLDPMTVSLKVAEAIVDMKQTHSRVGLYAPPAPKEFK